MLLNFDEMGFFFVIQSFLLFFHTKTQQLQII